MEVEATPANCDTATATVVVTNNCSSDDTVAINSGGSVIEMIL
jgi:hypothetical protein